MLYPTTVEGEFEKHILYQYICEFLACQGAALKGILSVLDLKIKTAVLFCNEKHRFLVLKLFLTIRAEIPQQEKISIFIRTLNMYNLIPK